MLESWTHINVMQLIDSVLAGRHIASDLGLSGRSELPESRQQYADWPDPFGVVIKLEQRPADRLAPRGRGG